MDGPKTATPPPPRRGRLRVVAFFLLGLVALDFAVAANRRTWRAYDPDEYRERVRGCRREKPDFVIVGGSPVSEGVDPAVLAGLTWRGCPLDRPYNLGLPGATTSEVWHAVEHGAVTPPRLLVYGVTASDLNDGRDEPHGPQSLMDAADVACWARLRPAAAEWCARQWAVACAERAWNLYYFRNGVRLWAADEAGCLSPGLCPEAASEAREGLAKSAALAAHHGFAPDPASRPRRLDRLKEAGSYGPPFRFLDHYRLGGHLAYLHRLLDWAAARGVEVVLVDMPVSADLEERFHPAEFAAYRDALAGVEHGRGVRVLRASREAVGLSDADFADLIHLNADGAARFSAWLRGRLEAGSH
jgi:hypothetical protein